MNARNTFLATALLAATISANAIAEPAQESPPSRAVAFADLNLGSPAGVAALYRRIQNAANQVCEFPPDPRQLREVRVSKACRAQALEQAVMQVGIPALHALHLATTARYSSPGQLARNE